MNICFVFLFGFCEFPKSSNGELANTGFRQNKVGRQVTSLFQTLYFYCTYSYQLKLHQESHGRLLIQCHLTLRNSKQ